VASTLNETPQGRLLRQRLRAVLVLTLILLFAAGSELWAERAGSGRQPLSLAQYLLYPRIWLSLLFGIAGASLLTACRVRTWLRLSLMAVVFVTFAILPIFREVAFFAKLSPHPSPLCALTKPILFSLNARQLIFPMVFAVVLGLIGLLSIIGNKLFCGWACPIGALQEIAYLALPACRKFKPPFALLNTLRGLVLVLFVPVLILTGIFLYGYFNPFELLHWPSVADFFYIYLVAGVMVAAALGLYRPFCHALCPIGFLTWLLEPVSLARVQLQQEKCTQCGACEKKSPCLAVQSILAGRRLRPDCYACGACLASCPSGALVFKVCLPGRPAR
jgi:polyferredoxin